MQIEFDATDFANATHYVIRWFDATNVKIFEQTQSTFNISTVSPGHYRIGPSAVIKPSPVPAGLLTIRVAGKNAAGVGPESAPTAPFSVTPPAAPVNVVVIDPAL